jgi:protein TonB
MKLKLCFILLIIFFFPGLSEGQFDADQYSLESLMIDAVPVMAEYPGGNDSLVSFIRQNLKWPVDFCGQGRVFIVATIEDNGEISCLDVVRGLCDKCDEEALRVASLMRDDWRPAKHFGKRVRAQFVIPVMFKLE